MTLWSVSMVFAAGLTVLMASAGFNRPSWSRSYTTAWRYWTAVAAHAGLYLLLFMLCYGVLLRIMGVDAPRGSGARTLVLWLALALVACLRAVVPLSRRLRERLHRMAGIPQQALSLAKFIAEMPFEARSDIRAQARDMLRMRGIDADRDWLPLAQPLHQQMRKAAELFIQLRAWDQERSLGRYTREVTHELYRLRQRFDRLSFRVSRTLASIEQLGEIKVIASDHGIDDNKDLDDRLRHLVSDMISDVCEDIGLFYRDASVLAARGVLATNLRQAGRNAAFERMGFTACASEPDNLSRAFGYAALLMLAGLWIFFVVLPPDDGAGLSVGQRIAVILVIVMGTLAIAILPKFYFGFASGGLHRRTPPAFVVAAGACALGFSVLVNLAAGALVYGGTAGALQRLAEAAPTLPSTFLTGALVAWLTQDHRWAAVDDVRARRGLDAALFGAAWLLSAVVSRGFTADTLAEFWNWRTLAAVGAGLVLGAAMGAVIPELARRRRTPAACEAAPASGEPAALNPPAPRISAYELTLSDRVLAPVPAPQEAKASALVR
ncbi:hypothetical protein RT97_23270 [Variovorax paradoxus]|uniref:Uncharacterized protein n=1 Tax=Variovorax paradoxus TaxID=34073 RepID=A0A0D0M4X6_VARPD|nr:hypothetical protein [Variovorax paradoxus]KIQ25689.1 hypothetical protein RT97_23270 [Variovorax paradoxus]